MREVTVRDLLTMTVGQARDPAFTAMQGEELQEATGERLFDYLRPRLFEPVGIEDVTWDENPQGITLGMIGARLRTEDLAKIGQLLLQEGKWQGRQLVPAAYVEDAGSFHIATKPDSVPVDRANDAQMGYGYQFWLGRDGSFRMEGLGGQIVTEAEAFNDCTRLFYVSVGEQDVRIEPTISAVTLFREHGLDIHYASFPGDHEWRAWRSSLHDFARRLFR